MACPLLPQGLRGDMSKSHDSNHRDLEGSPGSSSDALSGREGILRKPAHSRRDAGGHCGLLPAPSPVAGEHALANPADAGGAPSAGGGEGHRPEAPGSQDLLTAVGDTAPATVYEVAARLLAPPPEERP